MGRGPKFTKQYVGGILAGVGLGVLLGISLGFENGLLGKVGRLPVQITAILLLPIGQTMAWKGQQEESPPSGP